jgi:hypothetical protein
MDDGLFLSTGKVARELGVTAQRIRDLCAAGSIESELTPGNQYRVPVEEVERLKRTGKIPPVPHPLPTKGRISRVDDDAECDEDFIVDTAVELLGPPSDETVKSADDVLRLRNQLEVLKLRRAHEEQKDWFRSRQADEDARAREEAEEAEARAAEERERERWARFQTRWVEFALASLPWELQGEGLEARVHARVKEAVSKLDPTEPDGIVERIVSGIVAVTTRPHRRRKEIEAAIDEAVDELPYSAGNWAERARESARAAVAQLGDDSPMREVRQAALAAVRGVLAQYHEAKRADADATERDRLIRFVPLGLSEFTEEGIELALKAVKDAWANFPVGTARPKLEEVRDAALAPWRQAVAERAASLRGEAAARQKQQLDALQTQLRTPALSVHRAPTINRRLTRLR